jgi:hypothetical protein
VQRDAGRRSRRGHNPERDHDHDRVDHGHHELAHGDDGDGDDTEGSQPTGARLRGRASGTD